MQLAQRLGTRFRGGEVIELTSDLGGGKTTFVRGLAAGIGSPDRVASPSFTLSREYRAGDKTIYHFDFYRLSDPGIIANELAEVAGDAKAIVVVEWADIVADVMPRDKVTVSIVNTGENERQFTFSFSPALRYLFEGEV